MPSVLKIGLDMYLLHVFGIYQVSMKKEGIQKK